MCFASRFTSLRPLALLLPIALLSACGGGSGGSSASSGLSGSVAVGAPITDGKLRILDANGDVVAADVPMDSEGRYGGVTLTGPSPYRIEACGYTGENYQCLYSVVYGSGVANVTPLTSATILLAADAVPEALMSGGLTGLDSASVNAAQVQLRSALDDVLAEAGVPGGFNFITGELDAGSRAGYDRVLDAVGVSTGQDNKPFVQITPRLGDGNLYLEQGSTLGTIVSSSGADDLILGGLETLFRNMSSAMASSLACSDADTGIRSQMASNARLNMEDTLLQGPDAVAQGLCGFFERGEVSDGPSLWGATLLSPRLGRCNLAGVEPVCRVTLVMKSTDGSVKAIGGRMGVTQQAGVWKFMGDLDEVQIEAFATAQRDRRIDGSAPVDRYTRALSFGIPALVGLQCAKVSQRDAAQVQTTVAYYKPHTGAPSERRLSLWHVNSVDNGPSLDPNVGATGSSDDAWLMLPEGTLGDAVIRNLYRGGRVLSVALYSDTGCTTPFNVSSQSEFEVELEGVPPVWSALPGLPWPDLTTAAKTSLRNLDMPAASSASYAVAWAFDQGMLGLNEATVCSDRSDCGEGGIGRVASKNISPGSVSTNVSLNTGVAALRVNDFKMLALYGRTGEGVLMQSNHISCPAVITGQACQ